MANSKRQRRYENRTIPNTSPQNKWQQMEMCLEKCRLVLDEAAQLSNYDWDNLQWPPGWSWEKWKQIRDYCWKELHNHREGKGARILGGPKQTAAFNEAMIGIVEIRQELRAAGELSEEE